MQILKILIKFLQKNNDANNDNDSLIFFIIIILYLKKKFIYFTGRFLEFILNETGLKWVNKEWLYCLKRLIFIPRRQNLLPVL